MQKHNPICTVCMGWLQEIVLNGEKWLKCGSCSFMKKDTRRAVTPVGKDD